jgi:endonuclease YncB( thermonuclease family)
LGRLCRRIGTLIYYRRYIVAAGLIALFILLLFFRHWHSGQWAERANKETAVPIEMDKSAIRPDDGDTFFYKDLPIRILGIDAPEIMHREHGIFEDQPYGRKAAAMTINIVRKARIVEYLPFQSDKYGRLLAHVFVDGELLSVHLIRAELAYENVSYYGDNGFPELAGRILRAAQESPRPPFEEPYRWRRRHQIR